MSCPVCGDKHFEAVWRHPVGIANGLCQGCGHVYLAGAESLDARAAYADFAQSYDNEYLLNPSTSLFKYAERRAKLLRQFQPDVSAVLEIGSGYGHFLHALGNGVVRAGLEPSATGATFARERFGLDSIVEGSFECIGPDWPGCRVDAVCSFHVLEHVRDPYAFLEFAKTRLTETGVLVLAVPELRTLNPDLIEIYFIRRAWHLHTFSKNSIQRLLTRAGFEIIDISREPATPMLRSSMLVISRWSDSRRSTEYPPQVETARTDLNRFHNQIHRGLAALREQMFQWHSNGDRVAIYGGGMHTRSLFDLAGLDLSAVECVIDDDPAKAGTDIEGVPCKSFTDAMAPTPPDIILISTLASEDALLKVLPERLPKSTQVFGVYSHFFK